MCTLSAKADSDDDVIGVFNFRCSVLVSMTPCSRSMLLKPSKAGTSLFSSAEPLNARFPNSGTPI
eukprot:12909048-Prorocentrum_lima.AAC.1